MRAKEAALAFKAWAQENHLLGREFPVDLGVPDQERDELFDSLQISGMSEQILRARHLNAVAFNEDKREVVVLTARKISQREQKVLPKQFGDNVTVRYEHGGSAQAGLPTGGLVHSAYVVRVNQRYACGGSIHPARHIGAGTLGCLVKDAGGALFGLTNNHVSGLCNYAHAGEKILAPGHLDIDATGIDPFTIGYHSSALPMVGGVPDNVDVTQNRDAALIKITDEALVTSFQGNQYDTPAVVSPMTPGQQVEKVGRTTGHTHGVVVGQLVGPFPVTYQIPGVGTQIAFFDDVFVIKGLSGVFSQPGDSGSLITSDSVGTRKAVGLLFAGDTQGMTYALPLEPILTTFGVAIVSGHNV